MTIIEHLQNLYYNIWTIEWHQYEGKPQFGFYHGWYDGYRYSLHIYKLNIQSSPY